MADETDVAAATAAAEVRVLLAEEQISVGKHEVTTGRVRVSTSVETFDRFARADLTRETVEVTRVPIGEPVTGALPQIRQEGDVTIVPVFEEVLVVEKRLVLKEELHLRKRTFVEAVEAPVTLRKQTARVDRLDAAQSDA